MHLTKPFRAAREVLGIGPTDDATAVKRAYRRAVANAPPDRDPEQFRRIRDAYEILVDPSARAQELLKNPVPLVAPPQLPAIASQPSEGSLAVDLLRGVLGRLPLEDLRPKERTSRSQPPKAKEGEG